MRQVVAQMLIMTVGLLGGCAAPMQPARIDRLSPEQLAAIPPASPEKAAEATRLTQQADLEARLAAETRAAREREIARWNEYRSRLYPYPLYPHWSAGIGYWRPYPHSGRFGWGGWFGF